MTCFRAGFFSGLFFNHFLPQAFITADIYVKIRYLFVLISATGFFLQHFLSPQLDFHGAIAMVKPSQEGPCARTGWRSCLGDKSD